MTSEELAKRLPEAPEGMHWRIQHASDGAESVVDIILRENTSLRPVAQKQWKVPAVAPGTVLTHLTTEVRGLHYYYQRCIALEAAKGDYYPPDVLEDLFEAPCASEHPLPEEVQ